MFTAHLNARCGMGAYWVSITAYHDASGVMTPQEAHNDYLELLASGGLVGLAIGDLVCHIALSRGASKPCFWRIVFSGRSVLRRCWE
mgnify:CR=1 FL=1